jgi:DNA-binding NarL/FixJ family response regulator
MIVDSDPMLRSEFIATLARANITRVIAANSAVEAYRRLDDCQPRAAFVDLNLKGAGGLAAAVQLVDRAEAAGFAMPVFLLVQAGGEAIRAAAQAIGAAGVLDWPDDWSRLAHLAGV